MLFSCDVFSPSALSTLTKGKHMVDALKLCEVRASVPGNHDFDHGVEVFEKRRAETGFPWVLSNCIDVEDGKPLGGCAEFHIEAVEGVRVGIVGIIEPGWVATLSTIKHDSIDVSDFVEVGRRCAKSLRSEHGCEVVIALTHMRIPNDEAFFAAVPEIDLFLGGHDHDPYVHVSDDKSRALVKSGTEFRYLAEITVQLPAVGTEGLLQLDVKLHEVTKDIAEDPDALEYIDKATFEIRKKRACVLGHLAAPLDATFGAIRTRETAVGNFVSDVMRWATNADIALVNAGALRADRVFPVGAFSAGDLLDLLPKPESVVTLEIPGHHLLKVLEAGVSQWPAHEGRFPQVSGIRFEFCGAAAAGERVLPDTVHILQAITATGEGGSPSESGFEYVPLDPERMYTLATTGYLSEGRDGYESLSTALDEVTVLVDDEEGGVLPCLLRRYFKMGKVVGRVKTLVQQRKMEGKMERDCYSCAHIRRAASQFLRVLRRDAHEADACPSSTVLPSGQLKVSVDKTEFSVLAQVEGRIKQV